MDFELPGELQQRLADLGGVRDGALGGGVPGSAGPPGLTVVIRAGGSAYGEEVGATLLEHPDATDGARAGLPVPEGREPRRVGR